MQIVSDRFSRLSLSLCSFFLCSLSVFLSFSSPTTITKQPSFSTLLAFSLYLSQNSQLFLTTAAQADDDDAGLLAVGCGARVVVLARDDHYWWCRHKEAEGWVVPDILKPLPKPPPFKGRVSPGSASGSATTAEAGAKTAVKEAKPAEKGATAAEFGATAPLTATTTARPASGAPPRPPQSAPLVALAGAATATPVDLVASIFYAALPPFTIVDANGVVSNALPLAAHGFKAPSELPGDRIRGAEEMVGPAIVSHDQTWRQALFPDRYAVDKATLAEAEAEAQTRREHAEQRAREEKQRQVRLRKDKGVCGLCTRAGESVGWEM